MARVNLDSKVWNDPRVKRLARLCGWGMPQTVGTLAAVWNVAYEAKSPVVSELDVDTAAERDGFSDLLQHEQVQLASRRDDGLYLCGVEERIRYLLQQAERGRMGGRNRSSNADRSPDGRMTSAKQTPSKRQASAKQPPDLPLTLTPDPALALDPDLSQRERESAPSRSSASPTPKSKSKVKGITADEEVKAAEVLLKLSERSGRKYGGSAKHVALVVSRLRAGFTVWDLRRVIGYCAIEMDWENLPKMQPYLRPETLFGPEAMEKYIYAARAWEPSESPPERREDLAGQIPQKTENVRPAANGEATRDASNVLPFPFPDTANGDTNDPAFEEPSWMTAKTK